MKKFRIIIAFALAILCLLSPLTQTVLAAELTEPKESVKLLDFSSDNETTLHARLSPSDLLSILLKQVYEDDREPTTAEKEYLDHYFEEYLIYDATLPPSLVSTETTEQGITVMAKSYSFQTNNNETLTYLPVRVTLGETAKKLSYSSEKKCFVAELEPSSDLSSLTVFYSSSVTLPKEIINRLVTMAFDDATNAMKTEQTMLEYTAALKEYQNYLRAMEEYQADCLAYDAYLSSLELYCQALAEYEKNQAEWETYRQKYATYEAYLSELAVYNEKKAQYDKNYAAYTAKIREREAYLKNLDRIRVSLVPIESLFLLPSDRKTGTLYSALQNSELVAMFEKYQGILTKNFGIPKETIADLRTDADRLNELLGEYNEKRKISEKEAFGCYRKNYDEICLLFNSLYERMSAIFAPPNEYSGSTVYTLMCAKLEAEYGKEEASYKKWRIKNVLSHIYLICLCLDDTRKPEATWNFYADDGEAHTYYFSNLLSQNLIVSDTNSASPSKLFWREEVIVPQPPIMPSKPTAVPEPLPPTTMEKPSMPTEVEKPTEPTAVELPLPPSESDHSLVLRTGAICLELLSNKLYDRTELTEDPTIPLPEIAIEKQIEGVSIYGIGGRLLKGCDPFSLPTPSEDSETLPISYEDGYDTYTFVGWSMPQGARSLLDGSSIYAIYQRTPKTYRATFVIDGKTVFETQVPVTETPVFEDSVDKESAPDVDYLFHTWDPPLSPIHADTVYVAKYEEQPRKYSVTFQLLEQTLSRQYEYQELPVEPTVSPLYYYSGASLFEFDGWDQEIAPVTQNITYTAKYRELVLAKLPDDADGTLSFATTAQGFALVSSENRISSLGALFEKASAQNLRLDVLFSEQNVTLSVDTAALQALHKAGATEIFLDQNPTHGTAIRFLRADGSEVILYDGELRVSLPHSFNAEANVYLSAYYPTLNRVQKSVSCERTETEVKLIATAGVYYQPYERFALTLNVGEHGQAMTNETIYSEGEAIRLTIHPDANYQLSSIFFKNPSTDEITVTDPNNIVMPAWNTVLCVEFIPVEYTIQFVFHGQTITEKHPFGAELTFPEIPTSFEEDGFFYTFIGWSSTSSVVTGDTVYSANYYSVRAEDVADDGEGGAIEAVVRKIVLPLAALALLILAVLITTPIVIVKCVKKKKKAKNNQTK